MTQSQNRLLQLVIAGLLLNSPTDVRATIYEDEPVPVIGKRVETNYGSYFGGVSTDYYDYYYRDYEERSGSSGGGDYSSEQSLAEDKQALCNAISSLVSPECDLTNPPVLTVNGCGSGMSTYLVPDYLMVNTTVVFGLGAIFSEACNEHDRCYGSYLSGKEECDANLETDMVEMAKARMSETQWFFYKFHVRNQAMAYSTALQTPPVLSFAQDAYASAQLDGACRAYSKKAKEAGCLN